MLPPSPAITRCQHCQVFFWLDDAPSIGYLQQNEDGYTLRDSVYEGSEIVLPAERFPSTWDDVPYVVELTEDQTINAIEQGIARTHNQMVALRRQAWQRSNDSYRDAITGNCYPSIGTRSTAARENLIMLKALLKRDRNYVIEVAEITRELELFDEVPIILKKRKLRQSPVGHKILSLANAHDSLVREITEADFVTAPDNAELEMPPNTGSISLHLSSCFTSIMSFTMRIFLHVLLVACFAFVVWLIKFIVDNFTTTP